MTIDEQKNSDIQTIVLLNGEVTDVSGCIKFMKGDITPEFKKETIKNIVDMIMKHLYPLSYSYNIIIKTDIKNESTMINLCERKLLSNEFDIHVSNLTNHSDDTYLLTILHTSDIIKKIRKMLKQLLSNTIDPSIYFQNAKINLKELNEICSLSIYKVEFIVSKNEILFTNKFTDDIFNVPIRGMSIKNTASTDGKIISSENITIII